MSAAAPVNVGGVGAALSPADVLDVAAGARRRGRRIGGQLSQFARPSPNGAPSSPLPSIGALHPHQPPLSFLFSLFSLSLSPSGYAPVALDAAALARIKKESPSPDKFAPEDEASARTADAAALEGVGEGGHARLESAEAPPSPLLTPAEARAVVLARLLSLANGSSRVRADVLRLLGEGLLNGRVAPALPAGGGDDGAPLAALAAAISSGAGLALEDGDAAIASTTPVGRALAASAAGAPGPTGLSPAERAALGGGKAAPAGVAALAVGAAARLAPLATAVAALSAEALRIDVGKALGGAGGDGDGGGGGGHPAAAAVRAEMGGLTTGSKAAGAAARGGGGLPPALAAVPSAHGALVAALAPAAAAARAELSVPAGAGSGGGKGGAPPPPALELATTQVALARVLAGVASLAASRAAALGGADADGLEAARAAIAGAKAATASAGAALDDDPAAAPALPAARAACGAGRALVAALAAEAAAALATARRLEAETAAPPVVLAAPAPAADGDAAPAPADGKAKGGKAGGGGKKGPPPFALGRGTALLALYLEGRLDGGGDGGAGGGPSDPPATLSASAAATLLSPSHPALPAALAALRSAAEANTARRRPKLPKGTRDMAPDQMAIRRWAFGVITAVFERHGAVSIDTPVFELRETLTGKYGEESKLIYDLADQGGEALSLRYDLTVPFARYAALHGVNSIKRYQVGKVYRRDQPAASKGRFREFFQCDFDVAGSGAPLVPDAEVLAVLVEVLAGLGLGPFTVKLNHRGLLDAGLRAAGVPASKFTTVCSSVDKLDKEPWEGVRAELVGRKGLAPDVADAVGAFVSQKGATAGLVAALQASPLGSDAGAASALADLALLDAHLSALAVPAGSIVLDMSLARGLDYYTGVIFEAVLEGPSAVGSIAAGGRYDGLVGMFSGADVPAVGVSIGIERVFALVEARTRAEAAALAGGAGRVREAETAALVTSAGKGMQPARMALAARLWAAGVPAEFGYKAAPNLGESLRSADAAGLPFVCVLGADEVGRGVVRVRDMGAGTEVEVPLEECAGHIAAALAAAGPRGLVAGRAERGGERGGERDGERSGERSGDGGKA